MFDLYLSQIGPCVCVCVIAVFQLVLYEYELMRRSDTDFLCVSVVQYTEVDLKTREEYLALVPGKRRW